MKTVESIHSVNQSIKPTSIGIISFLISSAVFIICAIHHYHLGPGSRLGGELYAGFIKASQSGSPWPLLTMDASPNPELQMPYCGWPPLYGLSLFPFALLGFEYYFSLNLLNFIIIALTGLTLVRLTSLLGCSHFAWIIGSMCMLSPGIIGNTTLYFCHSLVPLIAAVQALVFLPRIIDPIPKKGIIGFWFLQSMIIGFISGMSSWACYFGILLPLPYLITISFCQSNSPIERKCSINGKVARYMTSFLLGLIVAFALIKCIQIRAFSFENVITFRSSLGGDTFIQKVAPNLKGFSQAIFFTTIRFLAVVTPVIFCGLILAKHPLLLFGKNRMLKPESESIKCCIGLILPPLGFCVALSGEQQFTENAFHSNIWVVPACLIFAFFLMKNQYLDIGRKKQITITSYSCVLALLISYGHVIIPSSYKQYAVKMTPSQASVRSPDEHVGPVASKMSSKLFLGPILRQIFPVPIKEREQGWNIAPSSQIARQLDDHLDQDQIILGFIDVPGSPWKFVPYLNRAFVPLNEKTYLPTIEKLHSLGLLNSAVLIAPRDNLGNTVEWIEAASSSLLPRVIGVETSSQIFK